MRVIFNESLEPEANAQLYFCSHLKKSDTQFKRLMHMHEDFVEIILIRSGSGVYKIDGQSYTVNSGDLLIFNSHVTHDEFLEHSDRIETYCCGIQGLHTPGLRVNALISDSISPIFPLKHYSKFVYHYLSLMFLLLEDGKEIDAQNLLNDFLDFLQNNVLNNVAIYTEYSDDEFLQRVKNYIENFFYEEITLESLAKSVNVSPYYLSHQFKEKFECSLVKYLIIRRIGEAQTLLQNSRHSITDISFIVGFNNPSHFQTTFKKMVGVTPKQYRKNYESDNDSYDESIQIKSTCWNII